MIEILIIIVVIFFGLLITSMWTNEEHPELSTLWKNRFHDDKPRVFCSECKYFSSFGYSVDDCSFCNHPHNMYKDYNWREKYELSDKRPSEINRKNNCKWYERKKDGHNICS